MKIIEYFSLENKEYWLEQIGKSDWSAGKFLYELLRDGTLRNTVGENALVPLLTDGEKLVSFCTFAMLDEIQPTDLTPWIGFVYTFPEYRGHRYAGQLLDWCDSVATVMGNEAVYISTDQIGIYEKYGYEYFTTMKNIRGEDCRIYRKLLQTDGPEKDARMERGGKYKTEIVTAARKGIDPTAVCGFSCNHCFLGEWCGGCRSFFNCCSYGACNEKGLCPNIKCCKEKNYDGCYNCPEIESCTKGFYSLGKDGNAAKAQCLFIKKHGKEAFFRVQDNLHKKFNFQKVQEVLGYEIEGALKILEENL